MGLLLGLANCPAILPTLTIGRFVPEVSMIAICKITRNVSRILSAWNSEKLSAQSPPCSKKPLPSATSASELLRDLTSPAKTSGGNPFKVSRTLFKCSGSL